MSNSKSNLKISTINDHNCDQTSDKLYDPLRTVILHPDAPVLHAVQSPKAAEKTVMLDPYRRFSVEEANKLVTPPLTPETQHLYPSRQPTGRHR